LVEHTTENRGVVGSIPTLAIQRSSLPLIRKIEPACWSLFRFHA